MPAGALGCPFSELHPSGAVQVDLCFLLPSSYVEFPSLLVTQNVTLFGEETFTEVVKLKMKAQQGPLVAQWEAVCQPVWEIRVRSLVQEDLTCLRAAKPLRHNY